MIEFHEAYYQQFLRHNPYPRELKHVESKLKNTAHIVQNGLSLIDFSSNDYLGLARHPLLMARSQEYVKQWGVGASSSRLVTGNLTIFAAIEESIAVAVGKPAALILGSGYQTNLAVIEALLDEQVLTAAPLIFADRYCHNSLLTMAKYRGKLHRFQHNDLQHLDRLLAKYAGSTAPKFIFIESLYSMDGDCADLSGMIALAKQYQAMLYVDDAHAVGVYGQEGWGYASDYANDISIIMGTFSKALGGYGAYVGCSTSMKDYLINKCKGLIYATGLPPAVMGAIAGAIEIVPHLHAERNLLLRHAAQLREFFLHAGLNSGISNSHIVPWIIGDAEKSLRISHLLKEQGILAATIRPPSVPPGKSRIRFCLSALHTDEDMERLMKAIQVVRKKIIC
jgi:8-amino-7-oxononanoate synthase